MSLIVVFEFWISLYEKCKILIRNQIVSFKAYRFDLHHSISLFDFWLSRLHNRVLDIWCE